MHVDLVKNEWLAGFQHVAARIYQDDGRLRMESGEPEKWQHLIGLPLRDREQGRTIDPRERPNEFFDRLHALIAGDYLFATEPHDEADCPYREIVVPIRASDPGHAAYVI